MNRYKYLVENVTVFALGNVLSKIVAFFLLSIFTQYLTPTEYGDGELIVTTVSMLMPILTLCVSDAVMRYLLDGQDIKEIVTNGILIVTCGSLFVLLISPLALLFGTISKYYFYIALLFIGNSFEQLFFNINKGFENIKTCALNALVSIFSLVVSSYFFLVVLNWGIYGYLLSIITAHLVCTIYLFLLGNIYTCICLKNIDKVLLKRMLAYSIPFIPSTIAWWLNSLSSRYLIVFCLGNSFNGLYSVAGKIPNLISIFTAIFHQAWTISGIKEYNGDTYSHFYTNIYILFSAFMFVGSSLLILFVPSIADLLFKGAFHEAWRYVPFMIMGSLFASLSGMLQPAFLAAKITGKLMISTMIGVIINILINVMLLKSLGLQIATISGFISFFVVWIIRWRMARKVVTINLNWTAFIASLLLILVEILVLIYNTDIYWLCIIISGLIATINVVTVAHPLHKMYMLLSARIKNSRL